MKILAVLFLVFVVSLASGKHGSKQANHGAGKRHQKRHHQHGAHLNGKDTVKKTKHGHHRLTKLHRKLYKKFAMIAMPGPPLEDASALQGQVSQPVRQVMVPVNSQTQNRAAPEMVSSYSSTPAQRSQPLQLGTEMAGDQTAQQTVSSQGGQPAAAQYQGVQQDTQQAMEEAKIGTQGDAGVAQGNAGVAQGDAGVAQGDAGMAQGDAGVTQGDARVTQGDPGVTQGEASVTQGEARVAQTEEVGGGTETVDPNAAANSVQSLVQPADAGKGESLQGYSGGALQAGSDQLKPQGDGTVPQEEIKVVNLGDDEKATNTEDRPCGGCPMNARCVNGQCQIREEDAQRQGVTGGKGTANNPGTMSDIHSLESQELKSLLKDATSADTTVGATAEPPPTSSHGPALAQSQDQGQAEVQEQEQQQVASQQPGPGDQQADQETTSTPLQQSTRPPPRTQPEPQTQPHFSGAQVKELRDFARMYKMYQFIRKMEERINDPDCAPVCRKSCKSFCPAKCCRHRHRHGNATLQASLAQTVASVQGTGAKKMSNKSMDAKLMEDDDNDVRDKEDGDVKDKEDKEDDEMDEKTGKKHVFVQIAKNNELDKPRRYI